MARVKGHTLHKIIANDYESDDAADAADAGDAAEGGAARRNHHTLERHETKQQKNPAKFGLTDIRDFLDFISSTPKSIPCTPAKKQNTNVIKDNSSTKAKKKPKSNKFWRKFSKATRNKTKKKTDKTIKRIKDAKHAARARRRRAREVPLRRRKKGAAADLLQSLKKCIKILSAAATDAPPAHGKTGSDAEGTSETYGDVENRSGDEKKQEQSLLESEQTEYTDSSSKHLEDLNSMFDFIKKQKSKPFTGKSSTPATPTPAAAERAAGDTPPLKHYALRSNSKTSGFTETPTSTSINSKDKYFRDPTTDLRVHFKILPKEGAASTSVALDEDVPRGTRAEYAAGHHTDDGLDHEFYYEPIIELKRKRTSRRNRQERFPNLITPVTTAGGGPGRLASDGGVGEDVPEAGYTYNDATVDPHNPCVEGDASIMNVVQGGQGGQGGQGARTAATFTAKNVAAFEIVVDLLDNTIDSALENAPSVNSEPIKLDSLHLRPNPSSDSTLNSIQVHIALPYSSTDVKKRSLHAARRVFSAVMSAPVDVRCRVPAAGAATRGRDAPGVTIPSFEEPSATPKMFERHDAGEGKESIVINKNILAALLDIYNSANKSAVNRRKRDNSDDHFNNLKSNGTKPGVLSRLASAGRASWAAVERRLRLRRGGRAGACRCRANRTECRACAAADAVIAELVFEFDNMARYASDHCTELQTYFWMNPSGGRKLKDAVHRLDETLNDYYRRVKGKCRGRTCDTFINKRDVQARERLARALGGARGGAALTGDRCQG